MFALLALLKGRRMKPYQHRFNVYSKVVYIIFQMVLGVLVCIRMLVALDSIALLCTYVVPYRNMSIKSLIFE